MINLYRFEFGTGEDPIAGLLPLMASPYDDRPAVEQFRDRYSGGWRHQAAFRMEEGTIRLCFSGDPPMRPLAEAYLREERVILYECDWVAVIQPNGAFEVSRMD